MMTGNRNRNWKLKALFITALTLFGCAEDHNPTIEENPSREEIGASFEIPSIESPADQLEADKDVTPIGKSCNNYPVAHKDCDPNYPNGKGYCAGNRSENYEDFPGICCVRDIIPVFAGLDLIILPVDTNVCDDLGNMYALGACTISYDCGPNVRPCTISDFSPEWVAEYESVGFETCEEFMEIHSEP